MFDIEYNLRRYKAQLIRYGTAVTKLVTFLIKCYGFVEE